MLKYEQWLLHETNLMGNCYPLYVLCIFHFLVLPWSWEITFKPEKKKKERMVERKKRFSSYLPRYVGTNT